MEPFTISALIAAIGSAMQYKAQQDALARQNSVLQQGLAQQRDLQQQAEQKALTAAQTYQTPNRQAQQTQIASDITQNLMQPVTESQAIRNAQTTTQGDVSNDYTTAKAQADLNTIQNAQKIAALLGQTTAASRLRTNEGINLMKTGQQIDQLANFSAGDQKVNNIQQAVAARPDPALSTIGGLMTQLGTAAAAANGFQGDLAPVFDIGDNPIAVDPETGVKSYQVGGTPTQDAYYRNSGGGGWKNIFK